MNKFDIIKSPLKGTNLIEASAGTGKTYTLASLYLRLILDKKLMIEDILAVTYTEAATEELRLRIRDRLKEAYIALTRNNDKGAGDELLDMFVSRYSNSEGAIKRLRHAIMNFDEASIFTIHGFCQRMLLENAFESKALFNTELITGQSELLHAIVDDFWRINFYNASPLFLQYAKNKKYGVEYFMRLIGNRSIDPNFEIIPDINKPDISPVEKKVEDRFKKLRTNWPVMKSKIENILLNNEGLKRNTYQIKSIPAMIISMDDFFSTGEPAWKFDKFIKFTSSSIQGAIKKGFEAPHHPFFDLCEEFENIYTEMTNTFDSYLLFLKKDIFEYVKREFIRRKNERNIRTFDDLLENMHQALKDGGNSELARIVRKRYKAALIDEFQDTDPIQYDIFTTIFSSKESALYLIGDPKQAIYRFRGADIFAYLKASSNMQTRYTLGTNWRSKPDLIDATNTIFKIHDNPFVFKGILFPDVEPASNENRALLYINRKHEHPMNIWFIDRHYADKEDGTINKGTAESLTSRSVAAEISRLISLGTQGDAVIGDRAIQPNDIAVLVRKNKQAGIIQDALKTMNIPSVIYSSQSIFESYEAMEIERVMTAVAEHSNERRIKAALSTGIFGLSGNDIFTLIEDESHWEERLNRFHEYHDLWAQHGFIRMFQHLLSQENIRKRLLLFSDGERRITNLLHCAEVLHRAETDHKLGMDGLIKWLAENRYDPGESDENQIRLETDEDAVKIITIHRSKGLEFPIVFCPFAWDSSTIKGDNPFTFHNAFRDNHLTLDLGSLDDKNRIAAEKEELAENMRLLYVALTRAKHRCYITWGKINQSETSALSYIFHKNDNHKTDDLSELAAHIKTLSFDAMVDDLKALEKKSNGSIQISGLPDPVSHRDIVHDTKPQYLRCREFNGIIPHEWMITSYSTLIYRQEQSAELPDYDSVDSAKSSQAEESEDKSIFSFPRGAKAGSCIHEIFENVDFAEPDPLPMKELINEKLTRYGFNLEWQKALFNMMNNVLDTPLDPNQQYLILRNIDAAKRLNELEFYFPLEKITSKGFADIFTQYGMDDSVKGFAGRIEKLNFKPVRGFTRGFIDLVFLYNDRYYIVDWKSNYLGDDAKAYSRETIQSAMEEHYYILQYHLYAVALHRYLQMRIPDYEYSAHFGGVFYIFVRGVEPKLKSSYGIYHDLPSRELIDTLSGYLAGRKKRRVS